MFLLTKIKLEKKLFETANALLKWQRQLVCYELQNTQLNRKS